MDLNKVTKKQLTKLIQDHNKQHSIRGYSKLKKNDLIIHVLSNKDKLIDPPQFCYIFPEDKIKLPNQQVPSKSNGTYIIKF